MINDSTRKPKAYELLYFLILLFFFFFLSSTYGQIGFSCIFWLGTLKIPGISPALFLERPVDFTD